MEGKLNGKRPKKDQVNPSLNKYFNERVFPYQQLEILNNRHEWLQRQGL